MEAIGLAITIVILLAIHSVLVDIKEVLQTMLEETEL